MRDCKRRGVSSSARYSTAPACTGTDPSASFPAATDSASPSESHDLPTFGGPASRFTPSAISPGTAHWTGGKCSAMSSSAVHAVRSRAGTVDRHRLTGPYDAEVPRVRGVHAAAPAGAVNRSS